MGKIGLGFFALVLVLSFIQITSGQSNLDVEKTGVETVIIAEVETGAKFVFSVTNNNNFTDRFDLYSLVGVDLKPKDLSYFDSGETKEFEVNVSLHDRTREIRRGLFVFDYEIKGQNSGFFKDRMTIKIVELKDAFVVSIPNIKIEDKEAKVVLRNLEDYDFDEVTIEGETELFKFSESTPLPPLENFTFTVPLDEVAAREVLAGTYDIEFIVSFKDAEAKIKGEFKVLEKTGVSSSETSGGLIIRQKVVTKTNEGNTEITTQIKDRKDILSRLFTTYSIAPKEIDRRGFFVEYIWEGNLEPTESLVVESTTNYTVPFILLVVIILVAIVVRVYITKPLSLEKRVSFVKTKGGEFALKVKINAKARKSLGDVRVSDRLPGMTKIYEKFGRKPDRVDEKSRMIHWDVGGMGVGEERVFSYIIYSKIKVIGRFELPSASATFRVVGVGKQQQTVFSNRTAFAAETYSKSVDED
jgi:hypothetical protein